MTNEDYIAFAQFVLDRFLGHEISEDLLEAALKDWRRESEGK